jgi:hypothetical protein
MSNLPVVRVQNISKSFRQNNYESINVLCDISFDIM